MAANVVLSFNQITFRNGLALTDTLGLFWFGEGIGLLAGQHNVVPIDAGDSREISCRRNMLSFFGIERVVDRALGCGHRTVLAVRYTRLCPSLGLDRPFPKTALDTLDYPVLDAAVFHAQPISEAGVVNFAQMGPPLLAAFRLDV